MYCKRCKVKMEEQKRSYHKKRKWTCPACGRSRMQQGHDRRSGRSSRGGRDGRDAHFT